MTLWVSVKQAGGSEVVMGEGLLVSFFWGGGGLGFDLA